MLNWYPGHMAKTKRLIRENLKWVDVVLELIDARLPVSSRNPILPDLLKQNRLFCFLIRLIWPMKKLLKLG